MSYTSVYIHFVWATRSRKPVLVKPYRELLFDHIRKNALLKGIYLDRINGHTDHVHCLVKLQGDQSIGRVAQLIKGEASYWFNRQPDIGKRRLQWQENYFAISVSLSQVYKVRTFIDNQEFHHSKKSFAEEYKLLMHQHLLLKDLDNSGEYYRINTGR
jgi:putative transposase